MDEAQLFQGEAFSGQSEVDVAGVGVDVEPVVGVYGVDGDAVNSRPVNEQWFEVGQQGFCGGGFE